MGGVEGRKGNGAPTPLSCMCICTPVRARAFVRACVCFFKVLFWALFLFCFRFVVWLAFPFVSLLVLIFFFFSFFSLQEADMQLMQLVAAAGDAGVDVATFGTGGVGTARPAVRTAHQDSLEYEEFRQPDANGDNVISKQEVRAAASASCRRRFLYQQGEGGQI